jgi:cell wall-associated NlpC family hydrolase
MDCSGFTQIIFKQHGIKLLRDAAQQATQGENIGFISDSRPGDLAFFDHNDGKISHVGLLIDEHSIIHCSGSVRIDPVDHQGIFDPVKKAYSHQLRLIRRILPQ